MGNAVVIKVVYSIVVHRDVMEGEQNALLYTMAHVLLVESQETRRTLALLVQGIHDAFNFNDDPSRCCRVCTFMFCPKI